MTEPFYNGPTIGQDKSTDWQKFVNRTKYAAELLKRGDKPIPYGGYAKQVKTKDGWEYENPTSVGEQFTSGLLRPIEKTFTGSDNPSLMSGEQVPEEAKTFPQKIAHAAGTGVGYAAQLLPMSKGVKALGVGEAVTKKLVGNQIAKTVGGELAEDGIKSRLRAYSAKKLLGTMVDDALIGGIQAGIESHGDPKSIGMGVGLGMAFPAASKYVASPIAKGVKQVFNPLINKFSNNLATNVKEGVENLSEQETRQALTDPKSIVSTIAKSADDTIQQVQQPKQLPQAQNQRGFVTTIKESPRTTPEVAQGAQGTYTPITNKQTLETARQAIADKEDDVLTEVLGPSESTADQMAKAQLLIDKYSNEGKHEQAIQIVENMAKKLTAQGQSIQAASMWNRLTPAGILKTAQRTFNKANELNKNTKLKLTPEFSDKLTKMSQGIQAMPEGEAKTRATLMMLKEISDQVPTSLAKKIDTVQTIGQLLNPKTLTRNVVGNAMFNAVENAQQTLASGLDKGVSLITGKRSMLAPNPIEQAKGAWHGIKQGYRDAIQGIDTSGVKTQFDLPASGVFQKGPMKYAEKGLNIALRTPDRAFYEAAKRDYVTMAKKLAKINGEDFNLDEALKQADLVAKYRTFQDDTAWSEAFSNIKNALNAGQEFGLGSFVLKYPKTPANLLARSVDYSPVSFVRALGTLGKSWYKGEKFNQAKFVTDMSKGMTGTGLIGMAYYLSDLGIITGSPENDKDIAALQKQEGAGRYKLNADALHRFIVSGFDPKAAQIQENDNLVSYDWAQPISTSFAIGSNIAKGNSQPGLDQVGKIIGAVQGGVDTLYEQPLLTGVSKIFQGGSVGAAAEKIGQGVLSSFVPTIVSQINQYKDNAQRDPYDPNFFQYSKNLAKQKIPGLAQDLPQAMNVWGEPLERYKDKSNSFLNVFFNPAFVSRYNPTPESQFVIDLFNSTGAPKHAPHLQERKVSLNGMQIQPPAKKIQEMQEYMGQRSREMYRSYMANKEFMNLPDNEKADILSSELSKIGQETKVKFLGDQFLKMAQASGDKVLPYKVMQAIDAVQDDDRAKDIYDGLTLMSKEEKAKLVEEFGDDPSMIERIKDIAAQTSLEKIKSLPPEEKLTFISKLPQGVTKKIIQIRKDEIKKYGDSGFHGLKVEYKARFILDQLNTMKKEEIGAYLEDLQSKGMISDAVVKEIIRIKKGELKRNKYLVPHQGYNIPMGGVQQ